jgi:hypothetical protein
VSTHYPCANRAKGKVAAFAAAHRSGALPIIAQKSLNSNKFNTLYHRPGQSMAYDPQDWSMRRDGAPLRDPNHKTLSALT